MFKSKVQKAALAAAAMLVSAGAFADSTAAITAIEAEITSLASAGWGLLTAVMVAIIGMKLFKKFVSRST
ncbi:MAG: hypothetical protein LAT55_12290 [Opitutales bacterium]|nr:hypothetical protein [Opitutales bacterium]